ncbi:MAG: PorT family protein [Thermoflavifilum sp.]|nr:PorT family protein [Thermoflavifilum sp.]
MRTLLSVALFTCLMAISFQVFAQKNELYFGVQGGLSIPNLQAGSGATAISKGYSSRLGPDVGIFTEIHFSPLFSLQPEVNYSSQGGKKNGQQAIPASNFNPQAPPGSYVYANYKSEAKLNYIQIPVLAKFGWNWGESKNWRFAVDAGPYVGFLVNAKNVTSGSSPIYADPQETQQIAPTQSFDANENIKDQIHKANFGIQGGVSLMRNINRQGYVFVHAGGNYGFLNIQKYAEDGKNHTGAAILLVGYGIRLNG